MTTIEAMRARVRTRLEETTAAVWSDAELDECVTGALEAYSRLFPKEATATASPADGATTTPVPAGAIDIRRVILADGQVVPKRGAPRGAVSDEELAWEAFAGTIHFTRSLAAGTITIWHTTTTLLADLPASDEGLIVLGGVVQALEARAVQDFKRGGQLTLASAGTVVDQARTDFERELARRGRRVRGGIVAAP